MCTRCTCMYARDPVVCRFSLLRRFHRATLEIFIFSEHDLELHKPRLECKHELLRPWYTLMVRLVRFRMSRCI